METRLIWDTIKLIMMSLQCPQTIWPSSKQQYYYSYQNISEIDGLHYLCISWICSLTTAIVKAVSSVNVAHEKKYLIRVNICIHNKYLQCLVGQSLSPSPYIVHIFGTRKIDAIGYRKFIVTLVKLVT